MLASKLTLSKQTLDLVQRSQEAKVPIKVSKETGLLRSKRVSVVLYPMGGNYQGAATSYEHLGNKTKSGSPYELQRWEREVSEQLWE